MRLKALSAIGTIFALSTLSLLAAVPEARLADAAKASDKTAIRSLIEKHADVNAAQIDGSTALHWAVYQELQREG